MNKLLVTGGAGFIGSHLVDRLITVGNKVIAYDNLSSGRVENINRLSGNGIFQFVRDDLLNLHRLTEEMIGCDTVFHIAANADVRSGVNNTRIDLENNIIATHNVLEAMRHNNIKQIAFASSASVYGETPPVPMSESYGPLLPISLYGASKIAAEVLISAYCHTFGMQSWIFRFANIVGTKRRQGVIYDFVYKLKHNPRELEILGDGNQCKPYIHISDCIDGIVFGYEHGKDTVNIFNIGVDSATDVNTIAGMVVKEMGLTGVEFKYTGGDRGWVGDTPQLRFDMTKMKKLGWQAKLTSDEAVLKSAREIIGELN